MYTIMNIFNNNDQNEIIMKYIDLTYSVKAIRFYQKAKDLTELQR